MVGRLDQCLRQQRAGGVQLEQRVANQAKLVGHLTGTTGVTTRIKGPGFFGRIDALARLRQHGRVVSTQGGDVVVHSRRNAQAEGLAHGRQLGRFLFGHVAGLRAEKEQVVQQGFRHLRLALRQGHELHQYPGEGTLDIHVGGQQPLRHRFEETGGHAPEGACAGVVRTRRKTGAQLDQLLGGGLAVGLDNQQHQPVKQRTDRCVAGQGRAVRWSVDIDTMVIKGPQICRVHTLGCSQFLNFAVLGKQSHRLHRLVVQHGFEVFDQGKTGALDLGRRRFVAGLRTLDKALHGGLHGAEHMGWRAQADHLQRPHRLVQLLAGLAQR